MRSAAGILMIVLAVFLFFPKIAGASGSFYTLSRQQTLDLEPLAAPSALPGIYSNFNPRNIPELQSMRIIPQVDVFEPLPRETDMGSHRVAFNPPSLVRPPALGTSLPISDRMPPGYTDLNEWEDRRAFSSTLYTDTTLYFNAISDANKLSSRNEGGFYEQNLRYDLYTTRSSGDSLALILDTTHCNDKNEYNEGFTLNQLSLESRTARSALVFGHAYPEMSDYTITQQILGLYGVQRFDNTEIRTFGGYKAAEKSDLENPRNVGGLRVEHRHDESVIIGLTAVGTKDVHENPGSDVDLPSISNRVYAMDIAVKPSEQLCVKAEYAGSDTDYDLGSGIGSQRGQAYRFLGEYGTQNYRFHGGVEQADSSFLTPLGESPRDERAFFGGVSYTMNRYFSTRLTGRTSRDNIQNYKTATIVRNQPEIQITMKPSDYYRNLRVDLFYQPLHEYSDNGDYVDRYRDLMWFELNQKAGSMNYFSGFSYMVDKDRVIPLNNRNINKLDLKLSWDYDNANQLYGLFSTEQSSYRSAGGMDTVRIYGFGGRSLFHEDITLNLDLTHEDNTPTGGYWNSKHDRITLSMTKEYDNFSRLIIYLEGSDNKFNAPNRDFRDISTRLRYLRSF